MREVRRISDPMAATTMSISIELEGILCRLRWHSPAEMSSRVGRRRSGSMVLAAKE